MARSLEALQKQYNSAASAMPGKAPGGRGPGGGPGRGPGGPGMRGIGGGKPKNTLATIKRLLSYISKYKIRLVFVLLCMLTSTVTSLLGAYLLAPVINHLTLAVKPDAEIKMSILEKAADNFIGKLTDLIGNHFTGLGEMMLYVFTALMVLLHQGIKIKATVIKQ